jgi:hypothetical protein
MLIKTQILKGFNPTIYCRTLQYAVPPHLRDSPLCCLTDFYNMAPYERTTKTCFVSIGIYIKMGNGVILKGPNFSMMQDFQ